MTNSGNTMLFPDIEQVADDRPLPFLQMKLLSGTLNGKHLEQRALLLRNKGIFAYPVHKQRRRVYGRYCKKPGLWVLAVQYHDAVSCLLDADHAVAYRLDRRQMFEMEENLSVSDSVRSPDEILDILMFFTGLILLAGFCVVYAIRYG
jgi:hypothetical protein